ncbi:MAG: hypothetical protein HUK19_06305 [Fibrobacter sp.]|nr:hypothetical protein [Fibrobacter sp.]
MEISIKLTLIASVILIGYNLSQLLTSYDGVCEKVKKFKSLAVETNSSKDELKLSNTVLTSALSITFVVLTYLSGLVLWVVGLVASKMVLTCLLSNMELSRIMNNDVVDQTFFKWTKVDALANILVGIWVALILVA